jgi:hypothetical protein
VLKRTKEIGDAKATVEAIAATNLDTVVGKVQWNGQGVPPFAAKNVTKTSLVGGQWRTKDGNKLRHRHHRQQDRFEHSARREDGSDCLNRVTFPGPRIVHRGPGPA